MSKHSPGDPLFSVGTVHIDQRGNVVVEVQHGIASRDGACVPHKQENVLLPLAAVSDGLGTGSLADLLAKLPAFLGGSHAPLKDAAHYVAPPPPPPEPAKEEAKDKPAKK